MKRSTERIITSHAGSLPRPDDLRAMVMSQGGAPASAELKARLRTAVADVVDKQIENGIDVINDGELSKSNFLNYVRERLGGIETKQLPADQAPAPQLIYGRDIQDFPEYFKDGPRFGTTQRPTGAPAAATGVQVAVGPITYTGTDALQADIDTFKAALQGKQYGEAFLPSVTPGTIEHWLRNGYYPNDEAFLMGIADAMKVEYQAIIDAGFMLQLDDPDLPDAWQIYPEYTVDDYRRFAELRIDALNHALTGIPEDRVRFHICWGSYHGPHTHDIPLRDIIDLVFKVKAECYSIEASNPPHEHEWRVFEEVKLPAGKSLMPGVIGHYSDFIEHPRLVADRLVKYGKLVGRENVIAGTDCGLGTRVGHASICWAKFKAMSEGAAIATKELWAR